MKTISGNTAYRAKFAGDTLLRTNGRGPFWRSFDNCFEMGDGDEVVRRIVRRANKNPALRQAIENSGPERRERIIATADAAIAKAEGK